MTTQIRSLADKLEKEIAATITDLLHTNRPQIIDDLIAELAKESAVEIPITFKIPVTANKDEIEFKVSMQWDLKHTRKDESDSITIDNNPTLPGIK